MRDATHEMRMMVIMGLCRIFSNAASFCTLFILPSTFDDGSIIQIARGRREEGERKGERTSYKFESSFDQERLQ